MATQLDQEFVKTVRQLHSDAKGGFETLVQEVERLETLHAKQETVLIELDELLSTVVQKAPGYDWNADPLSLTLAIGEAHEHVKKALS